MRATVTGGQEGLTLIELLVSIIILGIVSTMVLMSWFSLQNSYSYSINSNLQRDTARQALSRMEREIRDAQARPLPNTDPALYRARPYWIAFYSTFNQAGNTTPSLVPHMVMYRLYKDGTVWRFQDLDNNGTITGVNMDPGTDNPSGFNLTEQQHGRGRSALRAHRRQLLPRHRCAGDRLQVHVLRRQRHPRHRGSRPTTQTRSTAPTRSRSSSTCSWTSTPSTRLSTRTCRRRHSSAINDREDGDGHAHQIAEGQLTDPSDRHRGWRGDHGGDRCHGHRQRAIEYVAGAHADAGLSTSLRVRSTRA